MKKYVFNEKLYDFLDGLFSGGINFYDFNNDHEGVLSEIQFQLEKYQEVNMRIDSRLRSSLMQLQLGFDKLFSLLDKKDVIFVAHCLFSANQHFVVADKILKEDLCEHNFYFDNDCKS